MSGNGFISSIRRLINAEEAGRMTSPSPFELLSQQMDDVLGDGGVLKQVVQPGEGPPVPQNASVLIRYSGFLEYSDHPFETNANIKYPQMMKLGRDVTLAGLELGLLTMKKGEFSRFLFQPQYAYGEMGCPPIIPAAAMVLYEVQILDFLDSGQVDDFVTLSLVGRAMHLSSIYFCHFCCLTIFFLLLLSQEEQHTAPLSTLLEVVNTLRSFGNRCFNQSRHDNAKDRYKQAVKLLQSRETHSDAEKQKITTALLPLYLNLSLNELRLQSPRKALKYGNKALEIDSANTKALFRCGQAYLELQEYESAQGCLITAQENKPYDTDINNLLRKVAICLKDSLDKQKDMCTKMFQGLRGPMKM
ncbi:inactive peptidyl-prolyl cis-trans isomerase FKBP6 [Mastacembelus armatus]|uniref:inactive peptidyl-prolyl cis-trans isomerase FKBP6 n=1 Tax=Mastacembelus armatus TaxID=205130 RepID=UPI001436AA39|nr:inactive peptidyl-prolyl cis-trans isomerase FKBP6 [Mastacembelus armatus]